MTTAGEHSMDFRDEIARFFELAHSAICSEDQFLARTMEAAERDHGFYRDYHHGISALFETTLVHLVVHRLLADDFPMQARWEDAYPGSGRRVDLVLEAPDRRKVAIEFKFWRMDDASDLVRDVEKLALLPADYVRRLLFAIWREPEPTDVNLRWLETEKGFKVIGTKRFPTHFRSPKGTTASCMMALLERPSST